MTNSFTRNLRQAGLVLAFTLAVTAVSSTESFAFSAEAQQMCTGDAFKLCSSEIPNIPKITACMFKHKAELSAGCRAVMDKDLAKGASRKVADARDGQ
jgi:hypothetical protein